MDRRPTRRKRRVLILVAVVTLLVTSFFYWDPEPGFHAAAPPWDVSARAQELHTKAIVVDLHVDSLLWPRNLTRRGGGQVDFPRMRQGGLDAAGFNVPTRFFGAAGLKAFHDRWPFATWFSAKRRLEYQLSKMERFASREGRELGLATRGADIRRNHAAGRLSFFHGIEGAHGLGDPPFDLERLKRAGVVFIGLVHLSDNEFASSSSGSDTGLTEKGRALIREMNQTGLLVDLAHASERAFLEGLELTRLPPVVSHAGARGVHDSWRNLSDAQIRAVAARGGVIGAMFAPPATRDADLEEIFRHIEYLVTVGGESVAALGSDFDGYVQPPIDATGLPLLTERMLQAGWSEERIRNILGENVLRLLDQTAPMRDYD